MMRNVIKIDSLAAKLPKRDALESKISMYKKKNDSLLDKVTGIVSLYVGEKEWGVMVKNAFDRTIRYYQRDKLAARDLVRTKPFNGELYQWLVGTKITAGIVSRSSAKRTVSFDISSRYGKIHKGGLAIEISDDLRDSMTINMMDEIMSQVVDAFDELETNIILKALSKGVANGSNFTGIKYSSHIFDVTKAGYASKRFTHDKMLDMTYVLTDERYNGDHMSMSLGLYFDLLSYEEFKDVSGNWVVTSQSKSLMVIEGATPGKPLLPGLSVVKLSVSPLHPAGEVILYEKESYVDFVIKEELNSEVAVHDGLHDISMITYRNKFGVVARNPEAAVKMINLDEISLDNKFTP
jgi:hypothetical protein